MLIEIATVVIQIAIMADPLRVTTMYGNHGWGGSTPPTVVVVVVVVVVLGGG